MKAEDVTLDKYRKQLCLLIPEFEIPVAEFN